SPGIKFATLMIGVEGKEESYSFELSGNVIGEADFSSSVGEGVFFFIEKQNEWDLQGDIVSELVSDYTLYEQTMLIGKVDGSGQLSFDWKVDDTSVMDVSLWINGEELSEYKPAEAYGRETIVLPEDQVNTVEWRMARGELWRSTSESSLGDEGKTLYLKSVNFTADNPDVAEDTSPSNSKSSGGAFHPLALVFLAVLFFFRRNAAGISKTYRAMSVVIVMLVVSSGWARAENRIIGGVDAEFRDY
ncbi:GlyGly-CTERM sorting domain-containing protein, partial [Oleiphilus sp. HI0132]